VNDEYHDDRVLLIAEGNTPSPQIHRLLYFVLLITGLIAESVFPTYLTEKNIAFRILIELM
jgi:hypothetical protein